MELNQLQDALIKLAVFNIAVGLIATAFMFWLLYLVIRAGVRDGMKQALEESRPGRQRSTPRLGDTSSAPLPEMHID